MDVTSLLNANSLAAGQQKEASRAPPRNRTPWDAGGYSLPINTVSSSPTAPLQNIHYNESYVETPGSPHHKFSDSRSSLSSFTSSLQSATHSRFSSMSTVSSTIQPMKSVFAENVAVDTATNPQPLNFGSTPLAMIHTRSSSSATQTRGSISPTCSLGALALVAEHQHARQQSKPLPREIEDDTTSPSKKEDGVAVASKSVSLERPSSPSDAILIKRTTIPSLRVNTGEQALGGKSQLQTNWNYLSAPLENHHQSLVQDRKHKRALSAPDFTGTINQRVQMGDSPLMGPRAEPTPPSSHHPDNASPTSPPRYSAPDTPPSTNMDADNQPIACMYIPNCDTGSQLRKAISHIFGRNKMCTRLIPQCIWVHYCRKHYQRSRYRNPKEYAKLQCDLVQKQIRAIREWSLANMKKGAPGVVQDWGLAVRKREQKRLDDLGTTGRKRTASAAFDQDSDDEDGSRGILVPATAVPEWLLALCGKGYSTEAILDIFSRLHTEILNDVMPCFPDIEILPNIVVDQDEPKSPKGYTKRGSIGGHKRSQSLGVGMNSNYYSTDRRISQPPAWSQNGAGYGTPPQKRHRSNEVESMDHSLPSFSRSRIAERPIESGRRVQQLSHRPMFPDIDEHQGGEEYYSSSQVYQHPLTAPTPQRPGSHSMAVHLENNNEHAYANQRPFHQRSYSDVSFARRRASYSPSPAPVHSTSQERVGHNCSSQYRMEQTPAHHAQSFESRTMSRVPRPQPCGHSRHQSTPLAHQAYPKQSMHSMRDLHPSSPNYGYNQDSNNLPIASHITETQQSRALYTSRR